MALYRVVRTHAGHDREVRSVAFTPDGTGMVSGSCDWTVRLWDALPLERDAFLRHEHTVAAVAVTPDGRRMLSGGWDRRLCVWSLETRARIMEAPPLRAMVTALVLLPGDRCAVAEHGGFVAVWSFAGDALQCLSITQIPGWSGMMSALSMGVPPPPHDTPPALNTPLSTDCWLAIGARHPLLTDDVEPSEMRYQGFGAEAAGSVVAGGAAVLRMARVGAGGAVTLMDAQDVPWPYGAPLAVASLALSADSTRLAMCTQQRSGDVRWRLGLWDVDVATGRLAYSRDISYHGHVTHLVWAPRSEGTRWLLASCSDGAVRLWHASVGVFALQFDAHDSAPATCIAVSPSGHRAYTGCANGTCRLWDLLWDNIEWSLFGARWTVLALLALARDSRATLTDPCPPQPQLEPIGSAVDDAQHGQRPAECGGEHCRIAAKRTCHVREGAAPHSAGPAGAEKRGTCVAAALVDDGARVGMILILKLAAALGDGDGTPALVRAVLQHL